MFRVSRGTSRRRWESGLICWQQQNIVVRQPEVAELGFAFRRSRSLERSRAPYVFRANRHCAPFASHPWRSRVDRSRNSSGRRMQTVLCEQSAPNPGFESRVCAVFGEICHLRRWDLTECFGMSDRR